MSAWAENLTQRVQVIHALILRETRTRYGKHRLGYLWAIFEPLTFIGMISGLFYLLDRRLPFGMDPLGFLTTGMLPYLLFAKSTTQAVNAVNANSGLLYFPQVKPLDLVSARVVLEFATTAVVFCVIMGGNSLHEGTLQIDDPLRLMAGFVLASALGSSVGLMFCGLCTIYPVIHQIHGPLLRPLFWISGIWFAAEELPTPVLDILSYNPVLHVVELVRSGWFPEYRGMYADPLYVADFILVFLFLGLTLERVARRRFQLS